MKYSMFELDESLKKYWQNCVSEMLFHKYPDGISADKRTPLTFLFDGCVRHEEDGKIYGRRLFPNGLGFNMIEIIETDSGADYVIKDLVRSVTYMAVIGSDNDVYFENPSCEVEFNEVENKYYLDFSITPINDTTMADMNQNRDFGGDGYTIIIKGLNPTKYPKGKKYIGNAQTWFGSSNPQFTIGLDDSADFKLDQEEIDDRGFEWLECDLHTRAGALGKSQISGFKMPLHELLEEYYD